MTANVDTIAAFLSSYKRKEVVDPALVAAGVLMLLFERENELRLLFTKRTEEVEHHKGQISFPGGAREDKDATIVETALRESEEEIGLDRRDVRIIGLHDDLATHTGFIVTPVVGSVPAVPKLVPSSSEVSEIFDVPFSHFLVRGHLSTKTLERQGVKREAYVYSYGEREIWGITAAIIRSFVESFASFLRQDEKKKEL
ncbi:MAG TPA: CoA pyrophosphatase [Bacteroidota bacterium]|nr:CoA pyrophosphatase [Bacteroidota bacterium]